MPGKWNWKHSLASKRASSKAVEPDVRAGRRRRNSPHLELQELENRTLLSVTASLTSGVLKVSLNASGDSATITPSGSSVSVTGTNFPLSGQSSLFSGVSAIVVTGTNSPTNDAPNESVTFGGSGGTITLHAATGFALNVSGVTSVNFTNVNVNATAGDVAVTASETTSTTNPEYTPSASVTVQAGAAIAADDVTLLANATSSYSSTAALGGVLDALGVAAVVADLEPSAAVKVIGSSTKISVNGAGGNVTLSSTANASINSAPTVGDALVPMDAAVAFSVVNSSAVTDVSGASVSAGSGAGTLNISSTNTTTATTNVTGSSVGGGAAAAVTLDNSLSQASVEGGSHVAGGTVKVLATTTNTANTTANSTAGGGGFNSEIKSILAGNSNPNYASQNFPPGDKYATSPAKKVFDAGGSPITVAGAVSVTKFTPTTAAYVDSSTVTSANAINIGSTATNSTSTSASGGTTRKNASSDSVGLAVAISDSDVSNTATVENTLGASSPTSLTAQTIQVQAGTSDAPETFNASATAVSGVHASDLGAAGALALNIVSNTTEASVANNSTQTSPLAAAVSMAGNVSFTAQDTATESASALPPEGFNGSSVAGGSGLGAAVAVDIIANTTKADVQDLAQLNGAKDLTFNAKSNDTVSTYSAMGSVGGLLAITPTAAITVVTNTTQAQVGLPSASNPTLAITGAFSATANHTALTSTAAGASASGGGTAAVGVSLALAVATDLTTSTTGRSINATGGGVTFEADGSAASLVSSSASAAGGPKAGDEKAKAQPKPRRIPARRGLAPTRPTPTPWTVRTPRHAPTPTTRARPSRTPGGNRSRFPTRGRRKPRRPRRRTVRSRWPPRSASISSTARPPPPSPPVSPSRRPAP